MALIMDPAIAQALNEQAAMMSRLSIADPPKGDALALRETLNTLYPIEALADDPSSEIDTQELFTDTADGARVALRWYTKRQAGSGSAVVYIHGGGMIWGSIDWYDPVLRQYVQWTGVPFLAVEYRLAPERQGESLAEDAFSALKWLNDHASELGLDADRIAIMGDSAGGGIAAGAAILARDRGVSLAKQILIYPMLDDRNTIPDPYLTPHATWSYDANYTGWKALLGEQIGTDDVSHIAAPARNRNFEGLAPAYIEVGTLDIFRDEDISYALRLLNAGVEAELHVHPGAPHDHDTLGIHSPLYKRWRADRERVLTSI